MQLGTCLTTKQLEYRQDFQARETILCPLTTKNTLMCPHVKYGIDFAVCICRLPARDCRQVQKAAALKKMCKFLGISAGGTSTRFREHLEIRQRRADGEDKREKKIDDCLIYIRTPLPNWMALLGSVGAYLTPIQISYAKRTNIMYLTNTLYACSIL